MDNSYSLAMRNPITQMTSGYQSPDTTRLTLEQEYNRMSRNMGQQQAPQSTAYTDYINTLNSCSDMTKAKILQDERFHSIYEQCEAYLKEYLYSQALPFVLESQQGRSAFEQLYVTTKGLKEEYMQRDLQKEKQLELLMQDEVVLRRLQELQSNENANAKVQSVSNNSNPSPTTKHNSQRNTPKNQTQAPAQTQTQQPSSEVIN